MSTFSFIAGADCAGISGRLAEALKPDFRSMVNAKNYIDYPNDLEWDRNLAIKLWQEADIVYSHHGFKSIRWALRHLPVSKKKRFLIHYHGASTFDMKERMRHMRELQSWPGAMGVVSTLDLEARSGLPWLPAPYDVNWLESLCRTSQGDRVKIAHAPTNRALKSTAALIAAVDRLRDEGYPVDLDIIENVTWAECLRRKATADIYFDQVVLGYGCNALESWGMHQPVIAGADDETLARMEDRIGYLPFAPADESSIYDVLLMLVESPQTRKHWAEVGMNYLRTWHDYPRVRDQWQRLTA